MWEPIPLKELQRFIKTGELALTKEAANFWELLKIEPVKWQEVSVGEEGGGFWVVAVFGRHVIWYNDIEEGFNISSYTTYGMIDEYGAEQDELSWIILRLYNQIYAAQQEGS